MAITNFITKAYEITKLVNIWLVIIFLCGVIGIFYGGRIPGSAIMGDENDFSIVMNMAIPIAFFLGLATNNKRKKLYYFGSVAVLIISVVLSFSRGGFVGLACVGFYCWIKSPKKVVTSFIIGIFIVLISIAAPEKYWKEVKSIQTENIEEGTGATRWYTWQCGWRMFLDHPIFGVGQGNFPWNIGQYEPEGGYKGRSYSGRAAHSIYFTLIPELGLSGLFLFVFMTYKTMKESKFIIRDMEKFTTDQSVNLDLKEVEKINKLKYLLYGLRGAMIGYLISGIFLSVLYYPHFWLLIAVFVCIFNWYKNVFESEILDSASVAEI